jgi:hypothetical protein
MGNSGFSGSRLVTSLVFLAIGVVLIRHNPFVYVTGPGQATVVFDAFKGLEQDRVEDPGLTLLIPGVDKPISYEVRTKVWDFTNIPESYSDRSAKALTYDRPNRLGSAITVNSADGQAFGIDVFVALRPNPATLDDLHGTIGENYMNTIVVPLEHRYRSEAHGIQEIKGSSKQESDITQRS